MLRISGQFRKENSRKSRSSILHISGPVGPETLDGPGRVPNLKPYMLWWRIKMQEDEYRSDSLFLVAQKANRERFDDPKRVFQVVRGSLQGQERQGRFRARGPFRPRFCSPSVEVLRRLRASRGVILLPARSFGGRYG